MMTPANDDFYVGYERRMPVSHGRAIRRAVIAAALTLIAAATTFVAVQRPLAEASFAYGVTESWTGYLTRVPAPALLVPEAGGVTRYWLVARGKHGAAAPIAGIHDGWVRVTGSTIEREPWRMIELAAAEPIAAPPGVAQPVPSDPAAGRRVTVAGEIVDSKCFLGVMNPGERAVHRDCATRCLSGGVTPMVVFRTETGSTAIAVLVSADGRPVFDLVRGRIGRPVELTGTLFELGDTLALQLESPWERDR
jgi:hypothetical protein